MNKIITAIANEKLNNKLIKLNKYNILKKDIQYQEALLEVLEVNIEVDLLILNESLSGEYNLENFIIKIKELNNKLKIIIILNNNNNNKTINNLIKNKINNIIFINETEVEKEIEKIINLINEDKEININKKLITVIGTSAVGKSLFSANLSMFMKNKYNKSKVLIIDFDFLNNNIHTIFGINKHSKKINNKLNNNNNNNIIIDKEINIKDFLIKINHNLFLLSGTDILYNNNKTNKNKLIEILNELKNIFDLIIIDTSSECMFEYNSAILNLTDEVIFLTEPNLLEVKKSIKLLSIYLNNWSIKKEKINIVLNKYNEYSINDKLLKMFYEEFKIIGKIKLNKKYNFQINNNFKNKIFNNKIKKEYIEIINNIFKNKCLKI